MCHHSFFYLAPRLIRTNNNLSISKILLPIDFFSSKCWPRRRQWSRVWFSPSCCWELRGRSTLQNLKNRVRIETKKSVSCLLFIHYQFIQLIYHRIVIITKCITTAYLHRALFKRYWGSTDFEHKPLGFPPPPFFDQLDGPCSHYLDLISSSLGY